MSVRVRIGRSSVRTLTVVAGGRTRAIAGKRLRKPLVVALRGPRTRVAATVRLADGRAATRTVTYARCR